MKDTRTLAQLAKEALAVQDACNLSGVVHGFSRAVRRLRELFPDLGTDAINQHPVCVLWSDKVGHLSGSDDTARLACAYDDCHEWAADDNG